MDVVELHSFSFGEMKSKLPEAKEISTVFSVKESLRTLARCRISRRTMLELNRKFFEVEAEKYTSFAFYAPKNGKCIYKPVDIIPSEIFATIDGAYADDICGILIQSHENLCKSKKIDLDGNVSLRLSADFGGGTTKITLSFIGVKGSDSGNSGSLILCYKGSDSTSILRKSFGYVESQLQNLRVINEDL